MNTESWEQAWAARDLDPARAERLISHAPHVPQARVVLSYLQWRAGQLKDAQESLAPALTELQQLQKGVWYGRALNTAACLAYSFNHVDEALLHLEEQIQIARSLGDVRLEAIGLHDLAAMLRTVHPVRAEQYLREAIELFETMNEPLSKPLAYLNLGDLQQDAGQLEAALTCYTQALSFPEVRLQPIAEAISLSSMVTILTLLGRSEEGHDAEARLQYLAETCSHPEVQAEAWLSLLRRAAPADVIARLSNLLPLLEAEGNALYLPAIHQRLSEAYARLGNDARALEHLQISTRHERTANLNQRRYVARAFESLLLLEETRRHNEVLRQHAAQLEQLSQTDHLTGLANRLALFRQAEQWAAEQVTLSVALFDIDGFKRVNDTWGHSVGDAVLVQVAQVLRAHAAPSDVVARYGGEEFVLLRSDASAPPLPHTCELILEDVRCLSFVDRAPGLKVTLSVGVACLDQNFQHLLEKADQRLYAVKRSGKNAVSS
ncbi:diguanylate cyclase (plasmid) [Deinococcus sp. KNUC1210]|uniref:tetratricopeptide repeat-containing diguanylate cyclase n=1 Tax=Deinococcus sp. KNUC1210 TaxID=2917691 RepID=UPI001EF073E2|nr:GGDEF domain-containing protein [Deinococcus sp. KNUC1210]ULH17023.1 diguanylate cyclase [Deinococcus sp. KNUC1210]